MIVASEIKLFLNRSSFNKNISVLTVFWSNTKFSSFIFFFFCITPICIICVTAYRKTFGLLYKVRKHSRAHTVYFNSNTCTFMQLFDLHVMWQLRKHMLKRIS